MPRKIIDYSKTVMYKIVSNDLNILDCYVGSTTDFTKRKCAHKSYCTNANGKHYNLKVYQFIRDNGNWVNWSMILIEMYPCVNHLESLQRERFWCENLNATLNSVVPSRTKQEYDKDHTEHKKQYDECLLLFFVSFFCGSVCLFFLWECLPLFFVGIQWAICRMKAPIETNNSEE
jgi:hypothetical protein